VQGVYAARPAPSRPPLARLAQKMRKNKFAFDRIHAGKVQTLPRLRFCLAQ
jgi:hypothetical protein